MSEVGDLVVPNGRLVMTAADMHRDRVGWLRLRRGHGAVPGFYCIGSSDTAGVLGVSFGRDDSEKRGTPVKVWLEKVRGLEQPDNAAMTWGRLHESTVADWWTTVNRSVTEAVGLVGSTLKPWHQTSLDRIVVECPLDREVKARCALEIKTRGAFGSHRWSVELPDDILAQICHQLFVTGFSHIHYAVLIGGSDYRQGAVFADRESDTIRYVIESADGFRETYLKPGAEVEPPWPLDMAAQSLIDLDAIKHPERVGEISVPQIGEVMELARIRAAKNHWTAEERSARAAVLKIADGHRFGLFEDRAAFELTPVTKTWINKEVLAERYPDAWADPDVREERKNWMLKIDESLQATYTPEE